MQENILKNNLVQVWCASVFAPSSAASGSPYKTKKFINSDRTLDSLVGNLESACVFRKEQASMQAVSQMHFCAS